MMLCQTLSCKDLSVEKHDDLCLIRGRAFSSTWSLKLEENGNGNESVRQEVLDLAHTFREMR